MHRIVFFLVTGAVLLNHGATAFGQSYGSHQPRTSTQYYWRNASTARYGSNVSRTSSVWGAANYTNQRQQRCLTSTYSPSGVYGYAGEGSFAAPFAYDACVNAGTNNARSAGSWLASIFVQAFNWLHTWFR